MQRLNISNNFSDHVNLEYGLIYNSDTPGKEDNP